MQWSMPLPDDEIGLWKAVEALVNNGLVENRKHLIEWLQNEYFLRGIRTAAFQYQPLDYIEASYEDETGRLDFRLEYALSKYQIEKGRFAAMDLGPLVEPLGHGIDSLRKASMGQATLEHLVSVKAANRAKMDAISTFLKAALVGVAGWTRKIGKRTYGVLEIIHPKELLPIPARTESGDELRGLIRHRTVPLRWAQDQEDFKFPKKGDIYALTRAVFYSAGVIPTQTLDNRALGGLPSSMSMSADSPAETQQGMVSAKDKGKGADEEPYVKLDEVWLYGPENTVARYIARCGEIILADKNYEKLNMLVPCPIGTAQYNDIGTFYGRTFLYPLIALNREIEESFKSLFELVHDADWLGMTLIPTTMGLGQDDFKQTTKPNIKWFEPVWDSANYKPTNIQPANLGDFPVKVAAFATDMLDRLSGQSDLLRGDAPGRADSAASFQVLREAGQTALQSPQESLAQAFSTAYKHMLYKAKGELEGEESIMLRSVDSDLVGVVIDPQSGKIGLSENAVPDVWEVDINVKAKDPRSRAQDITELKEQLQMGTIDPVDYRIISRKMQLDLPVGNKSEWETYRMTMFNIRLLFRDGKVPGTAIIRPNADQIPIALRTLEDFMAAPEFALSSKKVRRAFRQLKKEYETLSGKYPDALPHPEDAGLEVPDNDGPPEGGMPSMGAMGGMM